MNPIPGPDFGCTVDMQGNNPSYPGSDTPPWERKSYEPKETFVYHGTIVEWSEKPFVLNYLLLDTPVEGDPKALISPIAVIYLKVAYPEHASRLTFNCAVHGRAIRMSTGMYGAVSIIPDDLSPPTAIEIADAMLARTLEDPSYR